jgi:hypothetical protein
MALAQSAFISKGLHQISDIKGNGDENTLPYNNANPFEVII